MSETESGYSQPDTNRGDDRPQLILIAPPAYQLALPAAFRVTDVSGLDLRARNLAILSSQADVALILVDASFGLDKRDRWSKVLACLARIPHVVLGIENLECHEAPHKRFDEIGEAFAEHFDAIDCGKLHVLPLAAGASGEEGGFAWYRGPDLPALLSLLQNQARTVRAVANQPSLSSDQFAVHLCWSGNKPLLPSRNYRFVLGSQHTEAQVSALKHRINPETLDHQAASRLLPGEVGYANIALAEAVTFLPFASDRRAGSFWLEDRDSGEKLAFGLIRHELRRATNIKWHALQVDRAARSASKGQTPCVLWFTGLSGSGKSTVATIIDKKLHAIGKHAYLLDGDNVRHGLCRDLGFTDADRVENLRRISETAKLFVDAGLIVLVSFISPFRTERQAARNLFENGEFLEIFVDTPLAVCEARDPKGLYKKARAGQLKNFTGIDSLYEPPAAADIVLPGDAMSAEDLADMVIAHMRTKGLL